MPRWLNRLVRRVRAMAAAGAVRFTTKAKDEIATLGAPFDRDTCLMVLMGLKPDDLRQRLWSAPSAEWLFVFRVWVHGVPIYVKLAVRQYCYVISFHPDEGDHAE